MLCMYARKHLNQALFCNCYTKLCTLDILNTSPCQMQYKYLSDKLIYTEFIVSFITYKSYHDSWYVSNLKLYEYGEVTSKGGLWGPYQERQCALQLSIFCFPSEVMIGLSQSTFSRTIATNLGSASDLAPAHKEFQHNSIGQQEKISTTLQY